MRIGTPQMTKQMLRNATTSIMYAAEHIGARTSSSEGSCAVASVDMMKAIGCLPIQMRDRHDRNQHYRSSSAIPVCSVNHECACGLVRSWLYAPAQ